MIKNVEPSRSKLILKVLHKKIYTVSVTNIREWYQSKNNVLTDNNQPLVLTHFISSESTDPRDQCLKIRVTYQYVYGCDMLLLSLRTSSLL